MGPLAGRSAPPGHIAGGQERHHFDLGMRLATGGKEKADAVHLEDGSLSFGKPLPRIQQLIGQQRRQGIEVRMVLARDDPQMARANRGAIEEGDEALALVDDMGRGLSRGDGAEQAAAAGGNLSGHGSCSGNWKWRQ